MAMDIIKHGTLIKYNISRLMKDMAGIFIKKGQFHIIMIEPGEINKPKRSISYLSTRVIPFDFKYVESRKNELDLNLNAILFQSRINSRSIEVIEVSHLDKLIGMSFFRVGAYAASPSGYKMDFGNEDGFVFGTIVHPDYRLKGVFSYMMYAVMRMASEKGVSKVYGEIHQNNKRSISSHMSIGFTIVKSIKYIKVLGLLKFHKIVAEFE